LALGRGCFAGFLVSVLAGCGASASSDTAFPIPPGQVQVAEILPRHDGLQYCANLRAGDLGPPGSSHVIVHSFSAYISTKDPNEMALLAITGRYPGWQTPGTVVYTQPITSSNSVSLEIQHDFPLGIACMEAYGHGLRPSTYTRFRDSFLVYFTYLYRSSGYSATKFFHIHWGRYLPHYSPRHRPKN
jgi:hypothetical protein